MFYPLLMLVFFGSLCWSPAASHVIRKRASFYLANETMCIVDGEVYRNGDPVPTDDECERCTCRPPGFSCVLRDCDNKPGCKAVRKVGECCPEYICGCVHNSRLYEDGELIKDLQNNCYTCRCHGSSISCTFADCHFRSDCPPEYIPGECCPRYDHCPPISTTTTTTTTTTATPIVQQEIEFFNMTTQHLEKFTSAATTVSIEDISVSEHTTPGDIFTVKFTLTGEKISSIQDHDITVLMTVLPAQTTTYTETTKHVFVPPGTELTTLKDGLIVGDFDKSTTETFHHSTLKPETVVETDSSDHTSSTIHSEDIIEIIESTTDSHATSTEYSHTIDEGKDESETHDEITTSQGEDFFTLVTDSKLPTEKQTESTEISLHSTFITESEISKETIDQQSSYFENRTDIPSYTHETATDLYHTPAVTHKAPTTTTESHASLSTDISDDYQEEKHLAPGTTGITDSYETDATTKFSQYDLQTSSDELHTFSTVLLPQTTEIIETDEKSTEAKADSSKTSELDHATTDEEFLHSDHEIDHDKGTTNPNEEIETTTTDEHAVTETPKTIINLDKFTEIDLHHEIVTTDTSDSQSTSVSAEISDDSKDTVGITSTQFETTSLSSSQDLESSTFESESKDFNETSFSSAVESHTTLYTDEASIAEETNNVNIGTSDDSVKSSTINILHEVSGSETTETPSTTVKIHESTYEDSGSSSYHEEPLATKLSSTTKTVLESSHKHSTSSSNIETTTTISEFENSETTQSSSDTSLSKISNKESTISVTVADKTTFESDSTSNDVKEADVESQEITTITSTTFKDSSSNNTSPDEEFEVSIALISENGTKVITLPPTPQESIPNEIEEENQNQHSGSSTNFQTEKNLSGETISTGTNENIETTVSIIKHDFTHSGESTDSGTSKISINNLSSSSTSGIPSLDSYTDESITQIPHDVSTQDENHDDSEKIKNEASSSTEETLLITTVSKNPTEFTVDKSYNERNSISTDSNIELDSMTSELSSHPTTQKIKEADDEIIHVKSEAEIFSVHAPSTELPVSTELPLSTEISSVRPSTPQTSSTQISTTPENDFPNELPAFEPPLANILKQQMFFNKPVIEEESTTLSGEPGESENMKLNFTSDLAEKNVIERLSLTLVENDEISDNKSLIQEDSENEVFVLNHEYTIPESEINEFAMSEIDNRHDTPAETEDSAHLLQTESSAQSSINDKAHTENSLETGPPINVSALNPIYNIDENEDLSSNIEIMDSEELDDVKDISDHDVTSETPKDLDNLPGDLEIYKLTLSENVSNAVNLHIVDDDLIEDKLETISPHESHTNNDAYVPEETMKVFEVLDSDNERSNTPIEIASISDLDVTDISERKSVTTAEADDEAFETTSSNSDATSHSVNYSILLENKDASEVENDFNKTDASILDSRTNNASSSVDIYKEENDSYYLQHNQYESTESVHKKTENLDDSDDKLTTPSASEMQHELSTSLLDTSSSLLGSDETTDDTLLKSDKLDPVSTYKQHNITVTVNVLFGKDSPVVSEEYDSSSSSLGLSTEYNSNSNTATTEGNKNDLTTTIGSDDILPEDSFLEKNTTNDASKIISKEHSTTSNSISPTTILEYLGDLFSGVSTFSTEPNDNTLSVAYETESSLVKDESNISEDTIGSKAKNASVPSNQTYSNILKEQFAEYGSLGGVFITGKSKYNGSFSVEQKQNLVPSVPITLPNDTLPEYESKPSSNSTINLVQHMSTNENDYDVTLDAEEDYSVIDSSQNVKNVAETESISTIESTDKFTSNNEENNKENSFNQEETFSSEMLSTLGPQLKTSSIQISLEDFENKSEMKTNVNDLTTYVSQKDPFLSTMDTKDVFEIVSQEQFITTTTYDLSPEDIDTEQEMEPEKGGEVVEPAFPDVPVNNVILEVENGTTALHHESEVDRELTNVTGESHGPEKGGDAFEPTFPDVFPIDSVNLEVESNTTSLHHNSEVDRELTNVTGESHGPEKGGDVFEPAFPNVLPVNNVILEVESDTTALHHESEVDRELTNVTGESHGPEKGGDVFEPAFPDVFPIDSVNLEVESGTTALHHESEVDRELTNVTGESHGPEKGGDVFEPAFPDVFPIDSVNLEVESDTTSLHHNSEVDRELTNVTGESHGPEKGGDVFEPELPDVFPIDIVNLEVESETTTLNGNSEVNRELINATSESHGTEKGGEVFEPAFPDVFPIGGAESEASSVTSGQITGAHNMSVAPEDVLIKDSNSTKLLDGEAEINPDVSTDNGLKSEFIPPLPIFLKDFNKIVQNNNLSRDDLKSTDSVDESEKLNNDNDEDYLSDEESIQLPLKIPSRRKLEYPYHLSDIISEVFKAPGYDSEVLGYPSGGLSIKNAKILRMKRETEDLSKVSANTDSTSLLNEYPVTESTGGSHIFKNKNILLVEGYGRKPGGFFPITSSVIMVHSDDENETDFSPKGEVGEIKTEEVVPAIDSVDENSERSRKDVEDSKSHPTV